MTDGPTTGGAAPLGAGAPPVCPRHPDRVSYVRCQRCDRPVCPECQRVAPVGVQCVDCVREAARSGRAPRTVFGGRLAGERPVVTQTLVGICVVAYLLQVAVGGAFTQRFWFFPPLAVTEPWRFLTSAFLHGGLLHIAFNMYALWLTGPYLEQLFGRVRFAALYLLSGIGGSVVYLALASVTVRGSWFTPSLGASGAVFGLFGALLVANRRLNRDTYPILVLLVVNSVIPFVVPSIAWQAHVGGFVTGCALTAVLAAAPRVPRLQAAGFVAVAVVLVVVAAVKLASVPDAALALL